MCPYAIKFYATVQQRETTHVAYERPWRPDRTAGSKAALKEDEALLVGSARTSLGMK